MNRITKAARSLVRKAPFTTRISGGAIALAAIATLMFGATSAHAACGLTGTGWKSTLQFPTLVHTAYVQDNEFAADSGESSSGKSIVGLWHVVYTAGGSLFNQTLDQWHSDGTEFENAWLAPDTGNICFGVWKQIAPRTVRLHHIGWLFTPGSTPSTASGIFTLDEKNTLSRDGMSYSGTFTFKTYHINQTPTGVVVKGTMLAKRITVD